MGPTEQTVTQYLEAAEDLGGVEDFPAPLFDIPALMELIIAQTSVIGTISTSIATHAELSGELEEANARMPLLLKQVVSGQTGTGEEMKEALRNFVEVLAVHRDAIERVAADAEVDLGEDLAPPLPSSPVADPRAEMWAVARGHSQALVRLARERDATA